MTLLYGLKLVSALGCALIAGTFFAFSTFIMQSLATRPAAEGISAMQAINDVILRSLFIPVFTGTVLLCIAVALYALISHAPGALWLVAAGLLYVVGVFGVTMIGNVPLNNLLAKADPASVEGAQIWARYLKEWLWWNHVRTIAGVAATALFFIHA